MTSRHAIFATIALAGLTIAGTSMAQGLTREQVRAELTQAVAQGTLIADGQTGATFRELNPSRYPAMTRVGKSRADVLAELAQARADGTLIADGQTGATHRELSPALYPQMQATLPQNRDAQNAQSRQAPGAM